MLFTGCPSVCKLLVIAFPLSNWLFVVVVEILLGCSSEGVVAPKRKWFLKLISSSGAHWKYEKWFRQVDCYSCRIPTGENVFTNAFFSNSALHILGELFITSLKYKLNQILTVNIGSLKRFNLMKKSSFFIILFYYHCYYYC